MTETEVVDRLLKISPELKTAYRYYQDLLTAYQEKDPDTFFQLLRAMPGEVPLELHHIKKPFQIRERDSAGITEEVFECTTGKSPYGFCCKVLNLLSNKVE